MVLKMQRASEVPTIEQLDQRETEKRGELIEQLFSFVLRDDSVKLVQVGALLPEKERN